MMDKLNKEKLIELVKAAKNGDQEAFSCLYEYYITPVFRFIYFRVKNYQEAEDLTQLVFLKVWKALPDYKQKKNPFSSWLYTVVRNMVIDYWRKKKEWNISELAKETIKDEKKPIYDLLDEEKDFKSIREAIGLLTEDQQEIIILRFIEGLSSKEISKITEKSEEAVRQLQSRGIKTLREYLNKNL